jgi:hypothetical protein
MVVQGLVSAIDAKHLAGRASKPGSEGDDRAVLACGKRQSRAGPAPAGKDPLGWGGLGHLIEEAVIAAVARSPRW